jgi:hypothetical protein
MNDFESFWWLLLFNPTCKWAQIVVYISSLKLDGATKLMIFYQTSGYPWPSDILKSPGFFKPRETHGGAQGTMGGPNRGVTKRRFHSSQRNVLAPSLLELQKERRDTTKLGYPGRCRRQPPETHGPFPFLSYREKGERWPSSGTRAGVGDNLQKHTGPVPVHPWQRAWFMAPDLSLCGETGLRHRPNLILTPTVPHTWAPPGPRQVFFYHSAFWP